MLDALQYYGAAAATLAELTDLIAHAHKRASALAHRRPPKLAGMGCRPCG